MQMTENQKLRTAALIAVITLAGCQDDNIYKHVDANERVNFYYECIDHQKPLTGRPEDCSHLSWERALQEAEKRMEARK